MIEFDKNQINYKKFKNVFLKLQDIILKLNNSGHQDEYLKKNNYFDEIRNMIKKKQVYYNHFVDKKTENKIRDKGYLLKKVKLNTLPEYIQKNKKKVLSFLD